MPERIPKTPASNVDSDNNEEIMTLDDWKLCSRQVLHTLRSKGDPPPRSNIVPGTAVGERSFECIKSKLASLKAVDADNADKYSIVRGYRMFTLCRPDKKKKKKKSFDARAASGLCFCARPHVVIENKLTTKYICVTQNPREDPCPYIFVPSSLMHQELSDDEVLSSTFMLCDVLGGDERLVGDLMSMKVNLTRFEQRRLTRAPGEMKAPPALYIRYFPFFPEWIESDECSLPSAFLVDIALSFGMPFRPIEEDEVKMCSHYDPVGPSKSYKEKSIINALDLVQPPHPWTFEKHAWVPSTSKLHDFYTFAILNVDDTRKVCTDSQETIYKRIYNHLQSEYWVRLKAFTHRGESESRIRTTVDSWK